MIASLADRCAPTFAPDARLAIIAHLVTPDCFFCRSWKYIDVYAALHDQANSSSLFNTARNQAGDLGPLARALMSGSRR